MPDHKHHGKKKGKGKGLKANERQKKNLKKFKEGFNQPLGLKKKLAMIFAVVCIWLCCSGVATAQPVPVALTDGSLKVTWDAVTTNTDGTPCINLAGYKIYIGEEATVYTRMETTGADTFFEVEGLEVGRNYFLALTAYNTYNNESLKSGEVSSEGLYYKIPNNPGNVQVLEISVTVNINTQ